MTAVAISKQEATALKLVNECSNKKLVRYLRCVSAFKSILDVDEDAAMNPKEMFETYLPILTREDLDKIISVILKARNVAPKSSRAMNTKAAPFLSNPDVYAHMVRKYKITVDHWHSVEAKLSKTDEVRCMTPTVGRPFIAHTAKDEIGVFYVLKVLPDSKAIVAVHSDGYDKKKQLHDYDHPPMLASCMERITGDWKKRPFIWDKFLGEWYSHLPVESGHPFTSHMRMTEFIKQRVARKQHAVSTKRQKI